MNNKTLISQLFLVNRKWKFFCAALALTYAGDVMAVGEDSPYSINSENSARAGIQLQDISKRESYKISKEEYERLLDQLRVNDTNSIQDLVNKRVDFSQAEYSGYEALFCAMYFGNEDLVKALVNHGVDINYRMHLFSTPLMRAILDWKQRMIECLTECGADVNLSDGGNTPLTKIIGWVGSKKAIKYLVKHGADINKPNEAGETSLMVAVKFFDIDLVKFLIKLGADVNKVDSCGNTPLSITTRRVPGEHASISDG